MVAVGVVISLDNNSKYKAIELSIACDVIVKCVVFSSSSTPQCKDDMLLFVVPVCFWVHRLDVVIGPMQRVKRRPNEVRTVILIIPSFILSEVVEVEEIGGVDGIDGIDDDDVDVDVDVNVVAIFVPVVFFISKDVPSGFL